MTATALKNHLSIPLAHASGRRETGHARGQVVAPLVTRVPTPQEMEAEEDARCQRVFGCSAQEQKARMTRYAEKMRVWNEEQAQKTQSFPSLNEPAESIVTEQDSDGYWARLQNAREERRKALSEINRHVGCHKTNTSAKGKAAIEKRWKDYRERQAEKLRRATEAS